MFNLLFVNGQVNKPSLSSAKGLNGDFFFLLSFLDNLLVKFWQFGLFWLLTNNMLGVPLEVLTEQIKTRSSAHITLEFLVFEVNFIVLFAVLALCFLSVGFLIAMRLLLTIGVEAQPVFHDFVIVFSASDTLRVASSADLRLFVS